MVGLLQTEAHETRDSAAPPAIEDYPGFYIATGFSGHGFGLGPGAGKATAGMLTGRDTGFDLAPLRYARFFDGSRMQLNATI